MSERRLFAILNSNPSWPRRLHRLSVLILVLDVLVAGVVFLAPPMWLRTSWQQAADRQVAASERELQQLERLGGKGGVMTYQFDRWLASLWQGKRLAITLIVLSAALSGLCWHIATLLYEDVSDGGSDTPPSAGT